MNLENTKDTEKSEKKSKGILILKIAAIVLGAILVLGLVVGGILYASLYTMYINGIYDSYLPIVPQWQDNASVPDWNNLDPVFVGVKVTKEVTEYNLRQVNSPKEEYTGDISVKVIYFIDGKIVEKDAENYTVGVENNMLSTVGNKKITIRVMDNFTGETPGVHKTTSKYVYIPIKVVDDNSAKENSPFETVESVEVYKGNLNGNQWSEIYFDEYDDIKNMVLDPIAEVPPKDSDIINVLVLGTAKNELEPQIQRQKLETVMIASYNSKTNEINLVSVHNQLLGIRNEKIYPLSGVYAMGGAGAVINSVNAVLGTDIQRYVEIDLDNFLSFVNELGGVTVNLTNEDIEALALEDIASGEAILNGENAEKYLTDNGNDAAGIDKTNRQRIFLSAVFKKLFNMSPITAFKTINNDADFIMTNVPFSVLVKYALDAGTDLSTINFNRYFAPYGEYAKEYCYVVYDEKYRVYYANADFLKSETEKALGYEK